MARNEAQIADIIVCSAYIVLLTSDERFTRNEIAAFAPLSFLPGSIDADHYDEANSPPDCSAPSSFYGVLIRISLPHNRERYSHLHPIISHHPSGQIARPLTTRRSPFRFPKRLWVIRQVSHSGKPLCTTTAKKPSGFSTFVKLASGRRPLGTPSKVYPTSAHRSTTTNRDNRKSSTG